MLQERSKSRNRFPGPYPIGVTLVSKESFQREEILVWVSKAGNPIPKQVKGEEGDLRKPLAGQKRDLGKRLALDEGENLKRVALEKKMPEAGEMVAGMRRATRSVTRALSYVELMRKQPGLTNTEKELEEGKKAKGSQDPLSSLESDVLLHKMFLEWVKKFDKKYESDEEQERRFKIWCSTKEYMDVRHSHKPGFVFSLDYMNSFADMTASEMRGDPLSSSDSDLHNMFLEWAKKKDKKYESEEEQDKRFKIWCSTKEYMDVRHSHKPGYVFSLEYMNLFADMTAMEMREATFSKDGYEGCRPLVCLANAEKELEKEKKAEGSEDPLSSLESDELHNMFLEWAKKENKKYKSEEEQEKRFMIWLSTKEDIDQHYSRTQPGYKFSLDKLNLFADMLPAEHSKMKGGGIDPYEGCAPILKLLSKTKEGKEELKKTRIEFNKWAAQHQRNYGSKKERDRRFSAYLENKRRINLEHKFNPDCWIYGYNFENMDKFMWEANLFRVTPS